jgi:hypothetical protein
LSQKLQSLGFIPSKADISLFIYIKASITIYVLVYVDDIIVVSSSSCAVDALHANLKNDFALKDLGNLHYFLGIEVKHTSDGLLLTQEKYSSDLLRHIGMMACKEATTPLSTSTKLSTHGGGEALDSTDVMKYRNVVGALQYLTLRRPDLSFAIRYVNTFIHQPKNIGQRSSAS